MPLLATLRFPRLLVFAAAACLQLALLFAGSAPEGNAQAFPKPVVLPGLHNAFRVDGQLISGSSPEDDESFRALANLGVKVLISVDGGKPLVERAREHGMRYVHLPIGYDGVPPARIAELMKAARDAEGRIYVHCHHGKHRGPAAVAAICRSVKNWDADRARDWLKQAGTGEEYEGLYRDVEKLAVPNADALARLPAKLPEIAETPADVDLMVAIDDTFELLKAARAAGWSKVPAHPDVTPAQAATLLWEHFREHTRTGEIAKRPAGYGRLLEDAESASLSLKDALRDPAKEAAVRDTAIAKVSQSCTACHKQHRN